jgi:glutathione S-transferase
MAATLFSLPGSHPSVAAALMLEHKGIDYRRIDFVPSVHRVVLRALGFRGITVPALRLDGARLQGSTRIARALDALRPEPPLFPSDPERRQAVERAEAWGDEVLQPVPRRLVWAALRRDRSGIRSFLEGARLGLPTGLAARTAPPVILLSARLNRASDDAVRRDLEALPGLLRRVEEWIEDGTLGSPERNAADFQVATSLRLLMTMDDVRPALEGRPAGRLALDVVPRFPGHVPPVFPAEWLAPLG